MAEVPDDLKYTAEHEWVRAERRPTVRIGITDFAQSALGDVVFVSLPEVGASVKIGEAFGEVESTKSVSDLFAPVSGIVTGRNDALADAPELVNSDPYGAGWVVEIELSEPAQLDDLLDAAAYGTLSSVISAISSDRGWPRSPPSIDPSPDRQTRLAAERVSLGCSRVGRVRARRVGYRRSAGAAASGQVLARATQERGREVFCTACGTENPTSNRYCAHCGTPLPDVSTSGGVAPVTRPRSCRPGTVADADGEFSTEAHQGALDALAPGSALLVVKRGPNAGSRFLLDQDVTTAGRHPDSDIFLDDVTVSRRHAEFRREGSGYSVHDVGSLNGTYVNRERIEVAALAGGDEVQIGKFRLVYLTAAVTAGLEAPRS